MRDVGGLPTVDGGEVASGRLLRSDNLQELSDADVTHLVDTLGVTDIVDLRSTVEVHLEGPGPLRARELVPHHHHSMFAGDREDVAAAALALPWSKESGRPRPPRRDDDYWTSHYLGYLAERPDSVSAALQVVAGEYGRHDRALRGRQGPHRHSGGHGPVGGRGVRRGHRGGLRRKRRAGRAGRGAAERATGLRRGAAWPADRPARSPAPRRCSDSWPCSPSATRGPLGGCASTGGPEAQVQSLRARLRA